MQEEGLRCGLPVAHIVKEYVTLSEFISAVAQGRPGRQNVSHIEPTVGCRWHTGGFVVGALPDQIGTGREAPWLERGRILTRAGREPPLLLSRAVGMGHLLSPLRGLPPLASFPYRVVWPAECEGEDLKLGAADKKVPRYACSRTPNFPLGKVGILTGREQLCQAAC